MAFFLHSVDTLLYPRLMYLNYHHSRISKAKTFGTFTGFMTLKSKSRAENEWNYKGCLNLSSKKKQTEMNQKKLENCRG